MYELVAPRDIFGSTLVEIGKVNSFVVNDPPPRQNG